MPQAAKPKWHKGSRLWYANIGPKGPDGRSTEVYAPGTLGEKDEPKAWEWFNAKKAELESRNTPVKTDLLTIKSLCELYLQHAEQRRNEGRLSVEHFRSKEIHLAHFGGAIRDRAARAMTPLIMDEFVATMQGQYAPNYVSNICATVAAAFNWAVRTKRLEFSPIKGFHTPVVPDSPERFAARIEAAVWLRHLWNRTERRLVASRYDRLQALMQRVLIHSGARPGELCCLLWTDIKWQGWTSPTGHACAKVTIPANRWKAGEATGKARTIYITPVLTRALRRLKDRPDRHLTHVFVHGRGRGGTGDGEPWKDGSTLSKTVCRLRRELIAWQATVKAAAKAGERIPPRDRQYALIPILDEGENRLTNYRWRHTAASTLLMIGVDVPTVAKLLGTSPEMIYRHYGHLLNKHLEVAAGKLAAGRKV